MSFHVVGCSLLSFRRLICSWYIHVCLLPLPPSLPPHSHQEELTRQAVHRAEEAEKGVSECKSRITMLELAMQQLRGSVGQMMLEETVVPLVVNSLPLPITSVSEVILPAATQVTEVTLPAATPALPIVTAITDTHTS